MLEVITLIETDLEEWLAGEISHARMQLTKTLPQRALISPTNLSVMRILVRSDQCGSAQRVKSSLKVNIRCKGWATMILPTMCDVV